MGLLALLKCSEAVQVAQTAFAIICKIAFAFALAFALTFAFTPAFAGAFGHAVRSSGMSPVAQHILCV